MPVNGGYIARRGRSSVAYLDVYRRYVLEFIVPTFGRFSEYAEEYTNREFIRLGKEFAEDGGDMFDVAESAENKGQAVFNALHSIGRTTLSLFVVGLFHLLEQQLDSLCRDAGSDEKPKELKMKCIHRWYKDNFGCDLQTLADWKNVDQLRMLANTVKHGEGATRDAKTLKELRPDLFRDPELFDLTEIFPKIGRGPLSGMPMAGEGVFVTREVFVEFSDAANRFFSDVVRYFIDHENDCYPVQRGRLG